LEKKKERKEGEDDGRPVNRGGDYSGLGKRHYHEKRKEKVGEGRRRTKVHQCKPSPAPIP